MKICYEIINVLITAIILRSEGHGIKLYIFWLTSMIYYHIYVNSKICYSVKNTLKLRLPYSEVSKLQYSETL